MIVTWSEGGGALLTSSSASSQVQRGLMLMSWSGQKKTSCGASKKTAGFLAEVGRWLCDQRLLSRSLSMLFSRLFKACGLIAGLVLPHPIHNADPHVGQGPNRHTVTFAFSPFALIIGQGPLLLQGRLPGKLVQGV